METILAIILGIAVLGFAFLLWQAHKNHVTAQQQAQTDLSTAKERLAAVEAKVEAYFTKTAQPAAPTAIPAPATAQPPSPPAGMMRL
jgi:uncharacterized membrane-anchored protein YhcB (DUF1043 family)